MLEHLQSAHYPARIVILGAGGFVGGTLDQRLKQDKANVLALTRQEVDLLTATAENKLTALLHSEDILVVICAEAPCKNTAMLYRNIAMVNTICEVLKKQMVRQVIYISSDAVYADSATPLHEDSVTAPTSLHGIMHLTREMMLFSLCFELNIPLAILRPSLLYGAKDP